MFKVFWSCVGRLNALTYAACGCGCISRQTVENYRAGDHDDFDDLLRFPTKVNKHLEEMVALWENAIAEQEEAEENFIMKHREMGDTHLETVVESIQNGPQYFFNSEQEVMRDLAMKVARANEIKAEIDKLFSRDKADHSFPTEYSDGKKGDKIKEDTVKSPIHNEDVENDDGMSDFTAHSSPAGKYTAEFSQWVTKVSSRWAGRLQNVNHLQGVFKTDKDSNESSLKVKPTWPEWLVDVTYEVMKRSVYGKLQRRTLKLTQYHILNVRGGIQITKSFKYKQLHDLYLRDENSFIIKFDLDGRGVKAICYYSPISAHIIQQITTRYQVTRALMKSGYSLQSNIPDSLVGYSTNVTALLIDSINTDPRNAKDNISDLVSFAKMLGERLKYNDAANVNSNATALSRTASTTDDRGSLSELSEGSGTTMRRRSSVRRDSLTRNSVTRNSFIGMMGGINGADEVWTPEDSKRLVAYGENSAENKLQKHVHSLLGGENTPEANTRQHFLETFSKENKNINDIRFFIDGMHEYIIDKRGLELVKFFTDQSSSTLSEIDLKNLSVMSFIVFSVIEETMFVTMKKEIILLVSNKETREEEEMLVTKMKILSARSQQDWDIPSSFISPHNWSSAVFELAGIERNPTPSRRLNALVRTAKFIYAEFKENLLQKPAAEGKGDAVLSADDLVPIFIYVLCQSGLKHPLLNRDILWKIGHPDMLTGECGYYLTIYESALQYLIDLDGVSTRSSSISSHSSSSSKKASEVKDMDVDDLGDYSILSTNPGSLYKRNSTIISQLPRRLISM